VVVSQKSQGKRSVEATESPHVSEEELEDLVGFVTTGDFNLTEGRGTGVGALSWQSAFGRGKKAILVIGFKIIDTMIMIWG